VQTQRNQRILTGVVLSAVVVAAIFAAPPAVFFVFCLAICTWAAAELVGIWRRWSPEAPLGVLLALVPALAGLLAWMAARAESSPLAALAVPAGVVLAASLAVLWGRTPIEEGAVAAAFLAFGAFYFAVPAVAVFQLHRADPWLVLLFAAVVGGGDTAAYFVGSWKGRHRIAPRISPKKSWEGSAAGVAAAVAVAAAWCRYRLGEVPPAWLLLAAATAVVAQLGDLLESLFKRGAGVKDSSDLLPGHGGIYDRVDAALLAAPVFAFGVWGLTGALE
jgi:phosphatidate cytidylyltransferase